jgi:hypothetical protein
MNRKVPLRRLFIVHRDAEAQHIGPFLRARKNQPVTDFPVIGFLGLAFQYAALDNPVLGQVESDF